MPADQLSLQSLSAGDGLWLPNITEIRPPNLMKALRKYLEQHGVELLEHTELVPLPLIDRLDEWQTVSGRKLGADKFIVTSGAWSFELLKENALKLNIKQIGRAHV